MDRGRGLPIDNDVRRRLDALEPAARSQLLRVLTMTAEARATRIGALYARPKMRAMADLLIDLEEDPAGRGVVIAELRQMERENRSG
jgi:hypothetical protein